MTEALPPPLADQTGRSKAHPDAQPNARLTAHPLLAFATAVAIINLDGRVVAPLLPTMAADLGVSIARAGWLVSSYLLPYGMFQVAYGPLADRLGKVRVAAWAMVVFSVGTALCGLRVSLGTMLAFRALTGAAAAAIFPMGLAHIGDTVPYNKRQQSIAVLMASAGAAQAFSTSAGGLIATLMSWRTVFPLVGGLGGVASLLLVRMARATPRMLTAPARLSYRTLLGLPGFLPLLLVVASEGLLFVGGFSFLGVLLEARFHLSPLHVGLVMSLAGLAQLAGARLVGRLSGRFPEWVLVATGGGGMGAAFLLSSVAIHWWMVAVACALVGAGFTICHSTFQTRATEVNPSARATGVALFAFSLFLGSGVGATVWGAAITAAGPRPAFAAGGILLVLFAVLAARFVARTGGVRREVNQ